MLWGCLMHSFGIPLDALTCFGQLLCSFGIHPWSSEIYDGFKIDTNPAWEWGRMPGTSKWVVPHFPHYNPMNGWVLYFVYPDEGIFQEPTPTGGLIWKSLTWFDLIGRWSLPKWLSSSTLGDYRWVWRCSTQTGFNNPRATCEILWSM